MQLTDPKPDVKCIVLTSVLDAEQAHTFRQLVRQALDTEPCVLCVDMGALTYIDSVGLGLLTLARSEAGKRNCTVRLARVKPGHPRRVLELMKFDALFEMEYVKDDVT